ncbi:protein Shroom3-like [Hippocampus zosterae]|uniref:protein Shroom3-like n=1 Tax=Hippocampus zosterae TaxID=109293 RepID=UPI00223D398F|nr:protein Shroom3-like [Hippocampus zosterae]
MDGGRAGLRQQAAGGGRRGGWSLVEAQLQGGAPWGFTLQGGLEHGEPLIISKVEEGGKADALERPLQAGDEIRIINGINLTGYRQEAIALVKGSYKTLQITVRREFDPGYIEEFGSSPLSYPSSFSAPSPPPLSSTSPPPAPPHQRKTSRRSRPCSTGGVPLRIKNRRSETASRPHSWHSTKLGEGQRESEQEGMDTMSSAWHHNYHASASTTDLSGGGFESDGGYLRKSPDQYSSRGSMESLDPPAPAHLQHHHHHHHHHHTLGHHSHGGPHPAYSSCQQLSSARSSNSIDHLHSKRDSAYSSFSTSSSIPEYLASAPPFSPERSYSLDTVPQRGGSGEMQHADVRYIRMLYNTQQGNEQEQEQEQEPSSPSALSLHNDDSRSGEGAKGGHSRDPPSGVCYRGNSSAAASSGVLAANRHSVGPIWAPGSSPGSYENLKGAPAPPRRSDSFAAIKSHERPNSWSSVEQPRPVNRTLQKGSYHHSSGPLASSTAKGSCLTDGQLHTVIEKSPESSPTTKPRQGFSPPGSPSGPSASLTSGAPQSGRPILPTGVYPVAQPEPHYAQMPASSPTSSASGVYPALANDGKRQQQQGPPKVRGQEEEASERWRDGKAPSIDKGHQMDISSPYLHSAVLPGAATPSRGRDPPRNQQEDGHFGHNRAFPTAGRSESQAGGANAFQRQQEPQADSPHHPHMLSNQGAHNRILQEQDFLNPQTQTRSPLTLGPHTFQERRDPYTTVQSGGHVRRLPEQPDVHPEPVSYSRVAQGQAPPSHLAVQPQHSSPRHHSDSAALHYHHAEQKEQNRDKEHPLTRLENALVEVQRSTSPNGAVSASSHDNDTLGEGIQGPTRSLSVLERVSRFEHCDREGKQRSQSISHSHHKSSFRRNQLLDKCHGAPCGAEDLRSMLERSTKAHRTMSSRGGGGGGHCKKDRTASDPSSALERSLSSLHLAGPREGDESATLWKQDVHGASGALQDASFHRSYKDSLKEAQSKVLRSTSLKQNCAPVRSSRALPSPNPASRGGHQPPPSEKKGPKTMPKPPGVVGHAPVPSPHAPKERHAVGPEIRGPSPPALPDVAPVGPPAALRIGGRKRLTPGQKKRSYSEPDNMNEIGISDPERGLFRLGGETSVADRRKMFELGFANNAVSRPDLRQLQQDAVAQYVLRKRNAKKDDGRERAGPRPLSAYLQSENASQSDTFSLSSTSSLLSLQDSGLDRSLSSSDRRHLSSPGADLRGLASNLYHPARASAPRAPSQPCGDSPPARRTSIAHLPHHLARDAGSDKPGSKDSRQAAGPRQTQPLHPERAGGSLAMVGSVLGSGKSASVEDLLERSEERIPSHSRSRSSPTLDVLRQDYASDQVKMLDAFACEPQRRCAQTEESAGDKQPLEGLASPHNNPHRVRPAGSSSGAFSRSPVPPRDRQRHRNTERQRAHSMSSLAASVGLPCPLSRSAEAPSRADPDAVAFPGAVGAVGLDAFATDKPARRSLSDGGLLEDASDGAGGERTFSWEERGSHREASIKSPATSSSPPPPHFQVASTPDEKDAGNVESHPSSLSRRCGLENVPSVKRSECQQQTAATSAGLSSEDSDEVFLLNPPPPSLQATDLTEAFRPPPAPLLELDQKSSLQTPPSFAAWPKPRTSTLTSTSSGMDGLQLDETLNVEYQPLPKREKTAEELRVETLARQLVMQDGSLAAILETSQGRSPVELVEEIFHNSRPGAKVTRETRASPLNDRSENGVHAKVDQRTQMEEKELNSKKAQLCEALRCSVAAMRREKELLGEEQKRHQALGASLDSLVHKLCKINERDKYSMFIGDLEKIVNLLLSLCGRLSRIDKSLLALQRQELAKEEPSDERDSLVHKRSQLLSQTEDARELKQNLDRRQRVVHAILRGYLSERQLQDYRHFVGAKPSLLIRQRNLDDLIRQRQEQLSGLAETLPPDGPGGSSSLGAPSPVSRSSPFPQPLPSSPIPGHAHSARSTAVTSL